MIDLRSDTVTRPTAAMRAAMAQAEVGDDVMGDDPSVQALQAEAAARAGKEAGLFFPSGTQSNLAAIMAHCGRGDEYLAGQLAHTYKYEGGGAAVLGSVQPQPIEHAADGSLPLEKIRAAIKPKGDPHFARTRLLALENTFHGQVIPQDYIEQAATLAREHGLSVHLDGARVFNAAVASMRDVAALCAPFDSVSICFSKGLGAPVGSVLVGSRELIATATRWRKVLGGGMRQAGVLAAACRYALEHHVDRLAQDHANAERLAQGLRGIDGVTVLRQSTNMVFVEIAPRHCEALTRHAASNGVLFSAVYGGPTRLVTHLDVSEADIGKVIRVVQDYFRAA
ncbi:low-specificity L-threonine aldolase [Bordetella genomosp. 9]|uniref:Low-specificity L-threonine aldolase n=1 Tax=Bordetella genomosp. 9 TaxID=1416803 RepID=A0A1W6Z3A1_9BORD|nr:low-specificity L-threonine aldolase [Bordetella genomosp. 9]ARP87313.1 low-specificity L-threonine aldolase [Bordetella genomosp. 9]ARP91298.1 low-specificity L-threonine aldolase [Bordetella genomosp. 9]